MFPADVRYFLLKITQILCIQRPPFEFMDSPRPVYKEEEGIKRAGTEE